MIFAGQMIVRIYNPLHSTSHTVQRNILARARRYGVAKPEDIKAKIEKGELKAHPAFEDYLSALAYQIVMDDMLKKLEEKLNELKGPT